MCIGIGYSFTLVHKGYVNHHCHNKPQTGNSIPNLQTPILSHGAQYTNYGISLPQPCPPPSNLSATAWEKQIKSSLQESDHALPCPTLWFFKSKADGHVWKEEGLEHTYSSYVRIQDVALKTCLRRWTIGKSGERESGISVLAARHDDYLYIYIHDDYLIYI